MITGLLLAGAVLAGVPWVVVAMLAGGLVAPVPTSVAVVGFVALVRGRRRRDRHADVAAEARYLAGVASELRSGSSLRSAVVAAGARSPDLRLGSALRSAQAGAPMRRIAMSLTPCLPTTGVLVGPAIELAATSGGRTAAMFDRLALRALDAKRARDEVVVSSAQAVASAWVVGLLPVPVILVGVASGALGRVVAAGTLGVGVVVAGIGMLALGALVVVVMVRGARS